jgi:hypothetical protein
VCVCLFVLGQIFLLYGLLSLAGIVVIPRLTNFRPITFVLGTIAFMAFISVMTLRVSYRPQKRRLEQDGESVN